MSVIISFKNILLISSLMALSFCEMDPERKKKLQAEIHETKFTNLFKGRDSYDSREW